MAGVILYHLAMEVSGQGSGDDEERADEEGYLFIGNPQNKKQQKE